MFGKSLAGNKYSRNFLHQAALRKTSPFSACPSARALPPRKTAIKNTPQLLARYLFGDPCGNLPRPKNSPRGCFCPAVRWTRGPGFSIPARVTFYARHQLKSAYKEKEAVAQGKNPSAAASLRLNASRSTKTLAIDPLISKKQITQSGPSE